MQKNNKKQKETSELIKEKINRLQQNKEYLEVAKLAEEFADKISETPTFSICACSRALEIFDFYKLAIKNYKTIGEYNKIENIKEKVEEVYLNAIRFI